MSAHTLISTTILSSVTTTFTIGSIPSTYRDLQLVINVIGNTNAGMNLWVNADESFSYDYLFMQGNGGSATTSANNLTSWPIGNTNSRNLTIVDFIEYARTDKQKYVFWRNDRPDTWTRMGGGRFTKTDAISSITIQSSNMQIGSSFYLYGIAA